MLSNIERWRRLVHSVYNRRLKQFMVRSPQVLNRSDLLGFVNVDGMRG